MGMIINALAIPDGYSEASFSISDSSNLPEWPRLSRPVSCQCRINRFGREISVEIEFSGGVKLECARCLKQFSHEVEGDTVVVIEPRAPERTDEADEDHTVFFYSDQQPDVDFSSALFDEIMTSLPIMPLCSENCAGIPVIEHDAARKKSEISGAGEIDPRWEVLKKLKKG